MNGEPLLVRGICYSPIPINESAYFAPYGDYFTSEYSFIWLRDLPLIKAMGANVVRTYGWQPDNDHSAFLDAAYNNGLFVMATFYMGDESETPVRTAGDRQTIIDSFVKEVVTYADHKALLFWSFGNELNGVWNKFLQSLSKDPDKEPCDWDERYDDLGGCWIHKGKAPNASNPCYNSSICVYKRLFEFIGDAAAQAKAAAEVLIVSAFADVDGLADKIGLAGDYAGALDAWTAQVYRGSSFGNFFEQMGNNTGKPVLLTEYGVDAYHDACGRDKLDTSPCYNTLGDASGSYEDEESQAIFATNLTREINEASSHFAECASAKRGDDKCICMGGFLMSWADEYWKGAKSQAACAPPKPSPHFSPRHCQEKAHVTCGNWDASDHDLCGYPLEASPDHYVNEEWFGITSPKRCADAIDALRPREIYWTMKKIWTGSDDRDPSSFGTCDEMLMGRCVGLGDGGETAWFEPISWLLGARTRRAGEKPLPCSGRGKCTTDLKQCGAGTANASATPCCACHFGFAGAGCTELDVRVYVALFGAGTLAVLLLSMIISSVATTVFSSRRQSKADLQERLLST